MTAIFPDGILEFLLGLKHFGTTTTLVCDSQFRKLSPCVFNSFLLPPRFYIQIGKSEQLLGTTLFVETIVVVVVLVDALWLSL
jgi:hypothetical protein